MLTEQQLVKCYPKILRYARKLDPVNAEDLAQEATLRCWVKRDLFDDANDSRAVTWALWVTHNVFLNEVAARLRDPLADASELDMEGRVAPRAERLIELGDVLSALDRHPHGELVRFLADNCEQGPYGNGHGHARAATRFGISEAMVRSRAHRARKAIRAQMEAA